MAQRKTYQGTGWDKLKKDLRLLPSDEEIAVQIVGIGTDDVRPHFSQRPIADASNKESGNAE